MSKASMSEVFAGRRGPASLDRLLWLVRTLLSYDDGEEVKPPERRDPQLQIWRERWHTLEGERASSRRASSAEETERVTEAGRDPVEISAELEDLVPDDNAAAARLEAPPSQKPMPTRQLPDAAEPNTPLTAPKLPLFAPVGDAFTSDTGTVSAVAFSPDSRLLATRCGNVIRLSDPTSLASVSTLTGSREMSFSQMVFSSDGHLIAAGGSDGSVHLWRLSQPSGDKTVTTPIGMIWSVALSPEGNLVAAGSADGTVRLWGLNDQAYVVGITDLTGHAKDVYSVAFSPDGRLLATGGGDKTVRLWSVAGKTSAGAPLTGHTKPVLSVTFSPDGRLLATGGMDGSVRLWDVVRRIPVWVPLTRYSGKISAVAFSPDGSLLVAGGSDGSVRLWSVAGKNLVGAPLTVHTGPVLSVAFSPDGRLLATGSSDGTVQLWAQPFEKVVSSAFDRPLQHPLTDEAHVVAVLNDLRSFVREQTEAGVSEADTMALVGASAVLWLESLRDGGLPMRAILEQALEQSRADERTVRPTSRQ
ncbi:WD40 repeat domain-containing protein [Streptomyces canus]|uniref:WD40 repeat domain-containing protein n=1 Tax=Streptomyces canus TaxID=58343 RepID=UPI0037112580